MKKITKTELYGTLEKFKGARQYYFATFSDNFEEYVNILDFNMEPDFEEHISDKYRIIENISILSNGFKINNSAYYFVGTTNIYSIEKMERTYIILHKPETNSMVIYENLSENASKEEKDKEEFTRQVLAKEKSMKELLRA